MNKKILFLLSVCTVFFLHPFLQSGEKNKQKSYKYELAVCAVFQNEAAYMKEWIEFHKLVGVEHFFLYNDQSADDYLSVLEPYIRAGEVELIQCPPKPDDTLPSYEVLQAGAFMDCLHKQRNSVKWMAFIDLDEFLFATQVDDLRVFLKDYIDHPAIAVNWQMFGTSDVPFIPADKLMIEMLVNQSKVNFHRNRWVKCIVQPALTTEVFNPHLFFYVKKKKAVNSDFEKVKGYRSKRIVVDKIRINHYYTRDVEHFLTVKVPRRLKLSDMYEAWLQEVGEMNEVYNGEILRFVPALKEKTGLE